MSLGSRALAPARYGVGTRWWQGAALALPRIAALGLLAVPPCSHRQGHRRPLSTFVWHWATLVLLLVPSLGMAGLFGTIDRQDGLTALVAVTLVSLLRALLDAAPAGGPWGSLPIGVAGIVECPPVAESGEAPEAGEAPLATCKLFDDAVRRALTNLGDPTRLAASPLLDLLVVSTELRTSGLPDTRLNRGAMLKSVLTTLLEGLLPAGRGGGVAGQTRRYYNCLYYPYVMGVTRRRGPTVLRTLQERRLREGGAPTDAEQVVAWLLQVDEDTYYKWQRRGSDAIAGALREREAAVGGTVPEECRASGGRRGVVTVPATALLPVALGRA